MTIHWFLPNGVRIFVCDDDNDAMDPNPVFTAVADGVGAASICGFGLTPHAAVDDLRALARRVVG